MQDDTLLRLTALKTAISQKARTHRTQTRNQGNRVYVTVIGDVVKSRQLPSFARRDLQRRIERTLGSLNDRFASAIAAKFLITIGDEFQGLLHEPAVLPMLIRSLEMGLLGIDVRLGIGSGVIETDLQDYAIGMDGPAWHAARKALEQAETGRRLGGVFLGFGERDDRTLNGIARVLYHSRTRMTAKQRQLLEVFLANSTQQEVAAKAGVTKQVISKQARAAGWEAYREAEGAWSWILAHPFPTEVG